MGNLSTFTPDFSDAVRAIIDTVLLDVNVCLPAKVVKYDSTKQFADVQIQLYQSINETSVTYPVIPNVPVIHPRANDGKAFIHIPLKAGDDVTLIFSQRSIDSWKSSGGMSDPNDPRKHHITDAYAIPGGSSMADAFKVEDPTALQVTCGDSSILLYPDGKFKVKNKTYELFDLIDQLFDLLLNNAFILTLLGPQGFIASTKLLLNQLRTKFTTLRKT